MDSKTLETLHARLTNAIERVVNGPTWRPGLVHELQARFYRIMTWRALRYSGKAGADVFAAK